MSAASVEHPVSLTGTGVDACDDCYGVFLELGSESLVHLLHESGGGIVGHSFISRSIAPCDFDAVVEDARRDDFVGYFATGDENEFAIVALGWSRPPLIGDFQFCHRFIWSFLFDYHAGRIVDTLAFDLHHIDAREELALQINIDSFVSSTDRHGVDKCA